MYLLPLEPPSHPYPCPTPLDYHRALSWAPCAIQQIPTSYLFYMWERAYVNLSLCTRWSMSNTFVTPWTAACQDPLSMGFARQEYWSKLPFPSPGDLSDPGIEPASPALAGGFFITVPPRKPFPLTSWCDFWYCSYFAKRKPFPSLLSGSVQLSQFRHSVMSNSLWPHEL